MSEASSHTWRWCTAATPGPAASAAATSSASTPRGVPSSSTWVVSRSSPHAAQTTSNAMTIDMAGSTRYALNAMMAMPGEERTQRPERVGREVDERAPHVEIPRAGAVDHHDADDVHDETARGDHREADAVDVLG